MKTLLKKNGSIAATSESETPELPTKIRFYLFLILSTLTILAAGLIFSIFREQEAIGKIGRYNLTWVVSQAAHETLRLQEAFEAYTLPNNPITAEDVVLRLQIIENRVGILSRGEVGEFIKSNADYAKTIADLKSILPIVEEKLFLNFEQSDAVALRLLMEPFVPKLLSIAAAANTWTGDKVAEDQKRLSLLYWSLTIILFIFIAFLSIGVCLISIWYNGFIKTLYQAKIEAEEADRAKTNFLAQMSHELRTPLNAIIGFSEMIEMGMAGPPNSKRYIEYNKDIKKSGQHLLALVNDVLDLAKMRSGAVDLTLGPIDVRDCLIKSMDIIKQKCIEKNLKIVTSPMPERWLVMAHQRGVQQVLINLIFNSIKFSPPGSQIQVSAQNCDNGAKLRIKIRDYGPGLTEAILSQVGKPFIDRGTTLIANMEGTGLGLAIVVELMRAMKGEFRIANEPDGGALAEIVFATTSADASQTSPN